MLQYSEIPDLIKHLLSFQHKPAVLIAGQKRLYFSKYSIKYILRQNDNRTIHDRRIS